MIQWLVRILIHETIRAIINYARSQKDKIQKRKEAKEAAKKVIDAQTKDEFNDAFDDLP